jgi:DNA polymerase-1
MARKFFLIDGHSYLYQAFYAISRLNAPDGQPVNAVYGFTNLLVKLFTEIKPDYIAIAMDAPGKTFRHALFEQYKATRKPMPTELQSQIPIIREIMEAFGVPVLTLPGYEADDIIGALAKQAEKEGLETFIVTRDKDAKQLLSNRVCMFNTKDESAYTPEDLKREWGIEPQQVIDLLALMGDASDNIPGVPGVGEKTALALIHEFGSLENVLENADHVKGERVRENLKKYADQSRLSREMVALKIDVPVKMEDIEKWHPGANLDVAKLTSLFEKLGFKRFLHILAQLRQDAGTHEEKVIEKAIEHVDGPVETLDASHYHLVDSAQKFEHLLSLLRERESFALDTETTSRNPMEAELVGISFSWEKGQAYYVPFRAPDAAWLADARTALDALKPLLENARTEKVGQNLKYEVVVLRRNGIELRGTLFDTMVAAWLLDSSRTSYGIDFLAGHYLGYRKVPTSDLLGKGKNQVTMDTVPVKRVSDYACEDADIAWRLARALEPGLKEEELISLFRGVEMPLLNVLADMEYNGVALDREFLARMSKEIGEQIESLAAKIFTEAGGEFNISSTQQLAEILFKKRGLASVKKTKTSLSTDAEVLETLARETDDPLPGMVLEYRQLAKLKSTYIDALPEMINAATQRVHTSFNQTGTATGRLSSSEPNLQNIPVRTELGKKIRRAFVAGTPENVLLTADYSQIELRMLAHLSRDENLVQAFEEGQDIHRVVAAQVFGVKPDEVTPEMRQQAKAVNFGIIYGQSAFGLSKGIGISIPEAKKFIDAYFARYKKVKSFLEGVIRNAESDGFVRTILNRKRPIAEITSQSPVHRGAAHRTAMNTVIQGSAADLIKVAMNNIFEKIRGRAEIKMVLQIHDELVFEVMSNVADKYRDLVEKEMTSAMKLRVPLKVDITVGRNWLEVN